MKKLVYSIITILTTVSASQAQIVLDRSDFPSAGDRFAMARDTMHTVDTNFYKAGTGKTWTLTSLSKDERFVSKYHTASSTPDGSMFPSADLAYQEDSTDSYMYYLETSSSEFKIVGANDSNDFGAVNFRAFIFPLQMNTAWTDTSKMSQTMAGADIGLPFDSVRFDLTLIFKNKVDAEGTIYIPDYNANVLRVRRDIFNNVDVSAKQGTFPWFPVTSQQDSSMSFDFAADNGKNWIARFDQLQDDDYEVMFRDMYPTSVKKIKATEVRVYPNPAKDMVIVELKASKASYSLMSITGVEVQKGELAQGSNELYFTELPKGMYMLNIIDNSGAARTERIVIE